VTQTNDIPTIGKLALQYGTITKDQYHHLKALHTLKQNENNPMDYDQLFLKQKFATRYQIGLLVLIQEYHIIKKRGEEFGKIAIARGFATKIDVKKAIEFQKKEFKRARIKKLIGDILVESRVITTKQKNRVLKEQTLLEQRANNIFFSNQEGQKDGKGIDTTGENIDTKNLTDESDLSDYEKDFLRIKVLDKEFAAGVIEKGLASEREVFIAQKVQEEEFEKENSIKILGDIMVTMEFITKEQKDIILVEQGRSHDTSSKEADYQIQVITSPDKMEAKVKINKNFLSQTTISKLKTALKSHGISNGIYPDALLQGLLDMGNFEFTAARSDYSSALLKAGKMVYHLETNVTDRGEKKKGDLLAEQDLTQTTIVKKNILGRETKEDRPKNFSFQCGSGTRISQDGSSILAAKTGVASLSLERKLFIHPIIHVLEDADLRYGPLEPYANLAISGVLTGAYPITAGCIKAREIRGARIDSIGEIRVDVGITDTIIRSQGDIHARYLHNCRIETFGNIYIENEIFDSKIFSSGKIDSPKCRIISSSIFAKKGVTLAGAGSKKTKQCTITAGGEHHIIELSKSIYQEIDRITKELSLLKEERDEQEHFSQKIFQKMVELKIFHDRAKNKKEFLGKEFKTKKDQIKKEKLKNIIKLLSDFETRMEKSIASLKELIFAWNKRVYRAPKGDNLLLNRSRPAGSNDLERISLHSLIREINSTGGMGRLILPRVMCGKNLCSCFFIPNTSRELSRLFQRLSRISVLPPIPAQSTLAFLTLGKTPSPPVSNSNFEKPAMVWFMADIMGSMS
jgi:hypothetical protein